ncbi:hypothetical protein P170DRAFT_509070 [Aspergillus steynii IBT 23096]|uniref:Uncharacterized protein n=1 Tax=Aspergillus steynii IBT 23096 TaxID=1392250 RepID=A0A2I2GDP9_9EURO|nr:uncharacterized protein P170DRAFT_509070 [Aspergillus steynii IBT 23096]PLB51024.1 hypothetical protein P170DRAFT_509070 [Aspergillus steynii IBT 23096]
MAEAASISTRDVQNLVNGDIKGDQITRDKIGGDYVTGDKFIVEIHNISSNLPIASQHLDKNKETAIHGDRQRILQLLCSLLQAELQGTRLIAGNEGIRALEKFHTLHYIGTLDTRKSGCEMRFSDISPVIATSALGDHKATLHAYASMRKIRQRNESIQLNILRDSPRLQQWIVEPCSSLAFIKSSFATRHALRDFAADIIQLLLKRNVPVVWALQPKGGNSKE